MHKQLILISVLYTYCRNFSAIWQKKRIAFSSRNVQIHTSLYVQWKLWMEQLFCKSWFVQPYSPNNEYIRRKMDVQDSMILDDITQKKLIWYGHIGRMDPTWLPKIMSHRKPEGRKKQGCPWKTWKDGIYTAMNERDLRMGKWNNQRQWKALSDVLKPRDTYIYIYTLPKLLCMISPCVDT
jgi:hypothetical protein